MIRGLARQVAHIAAGPDNAAIKKRWRDVNALRAPDRAPVWCKPVACLNEMLPGEIFVCEGPTLRRMEGVLRTILLKADIDDDSPVDDFWSVPAAFDVEPANRRGVDIAKRRSDESRGAWGYDPPLKDAADFDKLRMAIWTYNHAETQRQLDFADQADHVIEHLDELHAILGLG